MSSIAMYLRDLHGLLLSGQRKETVSSSRLPGHVSPMGLSSMAGINGFIEGSKVAGPGVVVDCMKDLVYLDDLVIAGRRMKVTDVGANMVRVSLAADHLSRCRHCGREIPDGFCGPCGIFG